jgi:hypothetical protein
MNEPVTSFPQAALRATMMAGRYRPGQHHQHNGFLQHAFATSPWLGASVVALIVLVGLALALIKNARRVLEGIPWSVRLALLVAAGLGIFRLLNRKKQTPPPGIGHAAGGWQPVPPPDRAA